MDHLAPSRRRRLGRDAREPALLDAAFEEFAAKGYEATRLLDVARRAGVAKGLVLFYFKSKEQLFEAVLRRVLVPGLFAPIDEMLARPEVSAEAMLRTLLRALYDHLVGNPRALELLRLILTEGPKFPELSEVYYQDVLARGVEAVQRIVQRGVASGEFRASAATLQPQMVHGAAIMAALWTMVFGERHKLDLEDCLRSQIDLLLNGLRAG
jgi:AcrR family transcriptional regulator